MEVNEDHQPSLLPSSFRDILIVWLLCVSIWSIYEAALTVWAFVMFNWLKIPSNCVFIHLSMCSVALSILNLYVSVILFWPAVFTSPIHCGVMITEFQFIGTTNTLLTTFYIWERWFLVKYECQFPRNFIYILPFVTWIFAVIKAIYIGAKQLVPQRNGQECMYAIYVNDMFQMMDVGSSILCIVVIIVLILDIAREKRRQTTEQDLPLTSEAKSNSERMGMSYTHIQSVYPLAAILVLTVLPNSIFISIVRVGMITSPHVILTWSYLLLMLYVTGPLLSLLSLRWFHPALREARRDLSITKVE